MVIRLAVAVTAAAVLCACAGPHAPTERTSASPSPAAAQAAASGPANAPVSRAGAPGAVALDAAQRAALAAAVAKAPAGLRPRLRYALAAGDDGKPRLVVYDGEGLGTAGRRPGHPHEYVVFRILNSPNGEHYDPQQNSIVQPIPPPAGRDAPIRP